MTSRLKLKKAGYATVIGLGLFTGAAGIAAAAGGSTPTPVPPTAVTSASRAAETPAANEAPDAYEAPEAPDDSGVNCENGIDDATGAECDGGPAANQDNDLNEPAGVEDAND